MNVARVISPLGATITVDKDKLKPKGSIFPQRNPSWMQPPCSDQAWRVTIKGKEVAIRETGPAAAALAMCLFTDAWVGEKLAAIAVVQRTGTQTEVVRLDVIGWAKTCSVLATELAAIAAALEYARDNLRQTQTMVFSDSEQALRAIQCGTIPGSKKMLLYKILEATAELISMRTDVRFRWIPGHEGIVRNEEANEAARAARGVHNQFFT